VQRDGLPHDVDLARVEAVPAQELGGVVGAVDLEAVLAGHVGAQADVVQDGRREQQPVVDADAFAGGEQPGEQIAANAVMRHWAGFLAQYEVERRLRPCGVWEREWVTQFGHE
jgi:hypothetical protein